MLPDFFRCKKRLLELAQISFRQTLNAEGVVALIKNVPYFEGNRFESSDVEGTLSSHKPHTFEAALCADRQQIAESGIQYFIQMLREQTERLHQEQFELFQERMDEAVTRTGNAIDTGGQPLTFNLYLDLLEKVDLEFDEQGNPDFSSRFLVVSPEMADFLRQKMPEWEQNVEFQRRLETIINNKREDWLDRESNRKLVDEDE